MSNINSPPIASNIADIVGRLSGGWPQWLMQVFFICFDVQNSGTTAQRPTTRLYTGKPFFDLTLGKPIWYKTAGWVDATGAAA